MSAKPMVNHISFRMEFLLSLMLEKGAAMRQRPSYIS